MSDDDLRGGSYDRLACAVIRLDRGRSVRVINRYTQQLLGAVEAEELVGQPLDRLVPRQDARNDAFWAALADVEGAGGPRSAECTLLCPDGRTPTLQWSAQYRSDPEDAAAPIVLVGVERADTDVSGEPLRTLAAVTHRGIVVTDPNGVILYANPAAAAITGYRIDELIGETTAVFRSGQTPEDVYRDLWRTVNADGIWQGEFVNRRKNGEQYLEAKTMASVRDAQGVLRYYVSICEDLSERQRYRRHAEQSATFDPLTGLANRLTFMRALSAELEMARQAGREMVLLHVDLDGFGKLNRELGSDEADHVLVEVASRLKGALRQGDLIARFSGDHFAMLFSPREEGACDESAEVAERLLTALRRPYDLAERSIELGGSVGIACYPRDGACADELVGNAVTATVSAKGLGGNRACRYDAAVADRRDRQHELREDLRDAVALDQLVLHFQPQLSLQSGQIVGVEALVRWQHPTRGLLGPTIFMPLADEGKVAVDIDTWVLAEACRQARAWLDDGLPPIGIAINFSARQFRQPDLPHTVSRALEAHRIEARSLEIEITESAMMQDLAAADRITGQLKDMGVRLSLDDFGTGYSSLSHLSRFPIHVVKIDQSFVRDITTNPTNAAIVQATIAMSKKLGKSVIAEGVETEEQMEFLRRSECDEMQGYLFSRALPADEVTRMLRDGEHLNFAGPGPEKARDTVLLVDDEPNILSALRRVLRREGYEILTAGSAEEGLAVLAKHPVQVIVSDQRMPGMNGTEFLSRVKSLHPQTVRLVLSGYSEISAVTDAINRGAIYRFLTKPWDDEDLKEEIRGAMRHWHERFIGDPN